MIYYNSSNPYILNTCYINCNKGHKRHFFLIHNLDKLSLATTTSFLIGMKNICITEKLKINNKHLLRPLMYNKYCYIVFVPEQFCRDLVHSYGPPSSIQYCGIDCKIKCLYEDFD